MTSSETRSPVSAGLDAQAARPLSDGSQGGSAVVDFALVAGLLTAMFLSILQLSLVLHVRSTLTDCAAEGARYGARADRSPGDAVQRTRDLVASELSPRYAARLADTIAASEVDQSGVRVLRIRVVAPLPLVGFAGPTDSLTVDGHAYLERQ
ncbi:MAG: TadE family protein [Angustibacter sp.]